MRVAPSTAKATALCNKALMPGVFCLKIEKKKKKKKGMAIGGNPNQKETNGFQSFLLVSG